MVQLVRVESAEDLIKMELNIIHYLIDIISQLTSRYHIQLKLHEVSVASD